MLKYTLHKPQNSPPSWFSLYQISPLISMSTRHPPTSKTKQKKKWKLNIFLYHYIPDFTQAGKFFLQILSCTQLPSLFLDIVILWLVCLLWKVKGWSSYFIFIGSSDFKYISIFLTLLLCSLNFIHPLERCNLNFDSIEFLVAEYNCVLFSIHLLNRFKKIDKLFCGLWNMHDSIAYELMHVLITFV